MRVCVYERAWLVWVFFFFSHFPITTLENKVETAMSTYYSKTNMIQTAAAESCVCLLAPLPIDSAAWSWGSCFLSLSLLICEIGMW